MKKILITLTMMSLSNWSKRYDPETLWRSIVSVLGFQPMLKYSLQSKYAICC
jgi:hypothetical protein